MSSTARHREVRDNLPLHIRGIGVLGGFGAGVDSLLGGVPDMKPMHLILDGNPAEAIESAFTLALDIALASLVFVKMLQNFNTSSAMIRMKE